MPSEDKPSFTQRCRQIAEELERSATLHPREIQKKIEQIERAAGSRCQIGALRRAAPPSW